jgi:uncharacterized OB-fold protein
MSQESLSVHARLAPVTLFADAEPGSRTVLFASRCPQCARTAFPRAAQCLACGAVTDAIELGGPARLDVRTAVLSQPPGALVNAPYEVGVATFAEAGISVIGLLAEPVETGASIDVVVTEPYPGGRTFAFLATLVLKNVAPQQHTEREESSE